MYGNERQQPWPRSLNCAVSAVWASRRGAEPGRKVRRGTASQKGEQSGPGMKAGGTGGEVAWSEGADDGNVSGVLGRRGRVRGRTTGHSSRKLPASVMPFGFKMQELSLHWVNKEGRCVTVKSGVKLPSGVAEPKRQSPPLCWRESVSGLGPLSSGLTAFQAGSPEVVAKVTGC